MSQHSMFSTNQYGRTRAATPSEETRNASYAAIQADLSRQQRRYLKLVKSVTKYGYEIEPGKRIYDITDREAAKILEIDKTSINGRRNELNGGSGSSEEIKKQPLVEFSQKRKCNHSPMTVSAWRAVPDLFDQSQAA